MWCVEISEKVDDDADTTYMDYRVDHCALNHKNDEELYCHGTESRSQHDTDHLPNCQMFRSNKHRFDNPVAAPTSRRDMFRSRAPAPEFVAPPANIFSYVQPMKYTIYIQALPDHLRGKIMVWEAGQAVDSNDATEATVAATAKWLSETLPDVGPDVRVAAIQILSGMDPERNTPKGSIIEFDMRTLNHKDFAVNIQNALIEPLMKALDCPVQLWPESSVACGPGEMCGFLYFKKQAKIYDAVSGKVEDTKRRSIHECTTAEPCKYEMMYEPPTTPTGTTSRVPLNTYHVCHSNTVEECG